MPLAIAPEVEEESVAAEADMTAAAPSLDAQCAWLRFRMARQRRLQAASAANNAMARQQRNRFVSAADADADALEDPNSWRQWAAICERQGVDNLS